MALYSLQSPLTGDSATKRHTLIKMKTEGRPSSTIASNQRLLSPQSLLQGLCDGDPPRLIVILRVAYAESPHGRLCDERCKEWLGVESPLRASSQQSLLQGLCD